MSFKIFHDSFNLSDLCRYFIYCFILLAISTSVQASQNAEEDYFFPSFRSGHNLSLFTSAESASWSANQSLLSFGDNKTQAQKQAITIDSASQTKMVMGLFFRYTYHINIISGFGFFVGSTIGFFASNGSFGNQKNFYPGYGISFPTILGGLVQSIGQDFRLTSGIEYGGVWFPKMAIYTQSNEEKELSAVPDMAGVYVGLDNFYTRSNALSINVGYRQIKSPCLNNCTSSIYLNSLSITSKNYYLQLGMTWIVGEFN